MEQVCGSRLDRWSSTCATDSRPFFPPLMPYLVNSSGHTGRQKRLKVHSTRTLGHRLAIPRLSAHPPSPSGRRRSVRFPTDTRVSACSGVVQTRNSCAYGSVSVTFARGRPLLKMTQRSNFLVNSLIKPVHRHFFILE